MAEQQHDGDRAVLIDYAAGAPSSYLGYAARLPLGGVTLSRCIFHPNPGIALGSAQIMVSVHSTPSFELEWRDPERDPLQRTTVSPGEVQLVPPGLPVFQRWTPTTQAVVIALDRQFVAHTFAAAFERGPDALPVMIGMADQTVLLNENRIMTEEGGNIDIFSANGGIDAGAGPRTSGFLGCAVAVVGSLWRARQTRLVTTYGSSRWATSREIAAAGLFRPVGVFLGRLAGRYLRHDGPEHVMAFAPTRSGKGVGLVIPTLLSWTGSTVIHDIKGENWQLTAGWRARFSHCLLFNPTDPRSARYNPLLEVRKGPDEVRDVQNIADILVDPEGALERRSHWEKTSHSLLVGAILHVLYAEEEKTLARVATFLSDPQRSFAHTLRRMMSTNHLGTPEHPRVHPVVASAAREVLNKSENERSGVLSTAMSFLGLYRDPTVAATTAACDWRITDLVDAERPVSLYLVIPPSDISRTKPLVRLVLNQIGRRLTERLEGDPGKRRKHQLLMMLDEFPALGRLDFFETALAFMAGYGIRAYLIAQSLNQISKAYGENNAILDNCHVRIAFSSNDERTAKRVSDALGTATELRAQRNYAGNRLSPWLGHVMVSRQETARPLLTSGEVMQLPPSDELVLVSGLPPIRARKLRYYEDRNFTARVAAAPALAEDGYRDRPAARPDDWSGQVRGLHMRLAAAIDGEASGAEDEGGLQRQRHPGLPEDGVAKSNAAEHAVDLGLDDESDTAADKTAMDRSRGAAAVGRAHAMNEGEPHRDPDRDLLPDF